MIKQIEGDGITSESSFLYTQYRPEYDMDLTLKSAGGIDNVMLHAGSYVVHELIGLNSDLPGDISAFCQETCSFYSGQTSRITLAIDEGQPGNWICCVEYIGT